MVDSSGAALSPHFFDFMQSLSSPTGGHDAAKSAPTSNLLPTDVGQNVFSGVVNPDTQAGQFKSLTDIASTMAQERAASDAQFAAQQQQARLDAIMKQMHAIQNQNIAHPNGSGGGGGGGYTPPQTPAPSGNGGGLGGGGFTLPRINPPKTVPDPVMPGASGLFPVLP